MYHLVTSLYTSLTLKPEYSILLLGLDNAGKTTLLERIKSLFAPYTTSHTAHAGTDPFTSDPSPSSAADQLSDLPPIAPTVGQNVAIIDLPDCLLRIWDVGGQKSLRGLWEKYYPSTHAIVFVVDSTDVGDAVFSNEPPLPSSSSSPTFFVPAHSSDGRLEECAQTLRSVLGVPTTSGIPLLVLANKQDREDCVEVLRLKEGFVRPIFEGERGGEIRDSRVLPISALEGTGVREAVGWVKTRCEWGKEIRPGVMR